MNFSIFDGGGIDFTNFLRNLFYFSSYQNDAFGIDRGCEFVHLLTYFVG